MEVNMKGSGKITINMDKASLLLKMVHNILGLLIKIEWLREKFH
jgi:uncharacterized protein YhbP (UPF0306 family)